MKKWIALLLAVLMTAALVACARQTETVATEETAATEAPAVTEEPAATKAAATEEEPIELLVYSGAGLKKAMEQIKTAYEADHNVTIEYTYAGSGELISQIELSGKGDVLIVGSESTYTPAVEKGFASETYYQVAHHPVHCRAGGEPERHHVPCGPGKGRDHRDPWRPEANAIGKTAAKLIEKNGLEGIDANVVSLAATVNEIVMQIAGGEADAGIVTIDNIKNNDEIEIIEIPDDQNIDQIIPIGTLTTSEYPDEAQSFVDFVASDAGKQIFENNGFAPAE
jgi:molybdate transport system substrate-binding protein